MTEKQPWQKDDEKDSLFLFMNEDSLGGSPVEGVATLDREAEREKVIITTSKMEQKTERLAHGQSHERRSESHSEKKRVENSEKHIKIADLASGFKAFKAFSSNNARWLIPLVLILLVVFISTYLRVMPFYLPSTDQQAEQDLLDFYKSEISKKVEQQFPALPYQNKKLIFEREWEAFLEKNGDTIEAEISKLSGQYKNILKDDNGDVYLLGVDTYLWYSEARNVINYGHLGDKIIDGESYFSLRDGRLDKKSTVQLHPYVAAYFYKFLHFFDKDITLVKALSLLPLFIMALSLVCTFFIGRKLGGNAGGFFAAFFLAINIPILKRTVDADTDLYIILLPLLISWLFLEGYSTTKSSARVVLCVLAGLCVGIFSAAWGGWSFIFFFILAAIIASALLGQALPFIKSSSKFSFQWLQKNLLKDHAVMFASFFFSSGIFVSLFQDTAVFFQDFTALSRFLKFTKTGVSSNVQNIWPKVQETVEELGTGDLSDLILQVGGPIFVVLALLGLIVMLRTKKQDHRQLGRQQEFMYFIFFAIWILGGTFAFTRGVRFALLPAPAFSIAAGAAFAIIYEKSSAWLHQGIKIDATISKVIVSVLLLLLLISPFSITLSVVKLQAPLINDGWHDTLIKIKDDSNKAIITSWWDFGHIFVAIAERMVTFDGGDQKKRIYWVGKALLTGDESEAIGILRMLNCAQETAIDTMDNYTQDPLKSVKILHSVIPLSDRDQAYLKYQELGLTEEQAAAMLEYTHCEDLLPNYFITSEDMVAKTTSWGYFGSWDFEKATMYQNTKSLSRPEAVSYLTETFSVSEERADQIYDEIRAAKSTEWIASKLRFQNYKPIECTTSSETEISCPIITQEGRTINTFINIASFDVRFENNPGAVPRSIVYVTDKGIEEKSFQGEGPDLSIVLIPDKGNYNLLLADPPLASSLFTRLFFLEGHGLKCFSKFNDEFQGGRIITWKIDYDCQQENSIFAADSTVSAG